MEVGLVSLPDFPPHPHQGMLSRTVPVSSSIAAGSKERESSSPALRCSGLAHVHSHPEYQFFCFAQVRCRVLPYCSWYILRSPGLAFLPNPGSKLYGGGYIFLTFATPWHMREGAGGAPTNRVSSSVLSRLGSGSPLPCAQAVEGQNQDTHSSYPGVNSLNCHNW